jgi:hypothetical protein
VLRHALLARLNVAIAARHRQQLQSLIAKLDVNWVFGQQSHGSVAPCEYVPEPAPLPFTIVLDHFCTADTLQTELAERLAGLLPQLQAPMAALYWGGLLATLRREWSAMDHHRLDKFLMLVRKFVAALFQRLEALKW